MARELHRCDDIPFLEVFVSTPLKVCEARDPKGLYAKTRAGLLTGLTGIDDPYEALESPELTLDTSRIGLAEAAAAVCRFLEKECKG